MQLFGKREGDIFKGIFNTLLRRICKINATNNPTRGKNYSEDQFLDWKILLILQSMPK